MPAKFTDISYTETFFLKATSYATTCIKRDTGPIFGKVSLNNERQVNTLGPTDLDQQK